MTNTADQLATGTTIGGYRVERAIAEGGMAMVYEAAHLILPRRVALKVMHAHLVASPQAAQRILQEACILEAFAHPGAVRVFECGVLADRRPWIAMELVGGEPLSVRLHRAGGRLPIDEILTMMAAITDVIGAAHAAGIVHRDLKPENVLVTGDDLAGLRVIDWGIARQPVERRLTLENFTLGTPTYMAPEQARGRVVDGRADVYALGVMAFEAATGQPPFQADNAIGVVIKHLTEAPTPVRALRPELPPGLAWLIDSMLEKDPAARPTADTVAARLARLLQPGAVPLAAAAVIGGELVDDEPDAGDDGEYDEIVVSRDEPELGDDDDDDDLEIEIAIEPAISVSAAAQQAVADALTGELDAVALDEVIAELEEEENQRRRRLARRWTPPHLVAAVTAFCDEPRPARRGALLAPRTGYDAVSGELDVD